MRKLRTAVLATGVPSLLLAAGSLNAGAGATTRSPAMVGHVQHGIEALAIDRNRIAYDVGSALHAVNLSSGKDRVVGKLPRGGVDHVRIDAAGLAYAGNRTLVFLPFKRVAAAVAG